MALFDPNFEIDIQSTAWNSKVFGIDTYEISIDGVTPTNEEAAIKSLLNITNLEKPSLFCCRVNANNRMEKSVLMKANFFNCETQLHLINNINRNVIPIELGKRRLPLATGENADYLNIAENSLNAFKFSRFHEDPLISTRLSNLRMKSWCYDMHKQKIPLLIYKNRNNEVESFIYYKKIDETTVELMLGGSMPGKGALTPVFWASFIEMFRDLGIKNIETKISASNIVIANIYIFFDFKIRSTYFDYHKHVMSNLLNF